MPQDTHQPGTRERILHAAAKMIGQTGVKNLSMSSIAEEAGVSRQTLYNHFTDIDSLVNAAVLSHTNESFRMVELMLSTLDSALEKLDYLVRHQAVAAIEHAGIPGTDVRLLLQQSAMQTQLNNEMANLILSILREGNESGEFRGDISIAWDGHLIQGLIQSAADLAAQSPDQLSAIISAARTMVYHALSSTGTQE